MDWDLVSRMVEFIQGLRLVGGHAGRRWELLPWQQWVLASAVGWKWKATGLPRTRMVLLQVARKNGKSTLMAGLALWELIGRQEPGRAVHVIANKLDQAKIVLDTARTMAVPLLPPRTATKSRTVQHNRIVTDLGFMDAQTAAERSLDGLNPSLWIGDEVAEWKGRFITKLTTAGVGRDDALGCLITTPGNNPDLIYPDLVRQCEKVLEGELRLDDHQAFIYGVDEEDQLEDRGCWP
jgi:phage terminase large subunit-like protein